MAIEDCRYMECHTIPRLKCISSLRAQQSNPEKKIFHVKRGIVSPGTMIDYFCNSSLIAKIVSRSGWLIFSILFKTFSTYNGISIKLILF